jgi:hypothetical protein
MYVYTDLHHRWSQDAAKTESQRVPVMRAAYMRFAKEKKLQRVYLRRCIEAGCCLQRRVCRLDVYLCVCMCVRERRSLGDGKTYIGV